MKLLVKFRELKLDFLIKQITPENQDRINFEILNLLRTDYFKKTDILMTSTWRFNVLFNTLTEYNQKLMRVTTLLKNNQIISADWYTYEFRKVSYDQFFTNENFHIDKEKELREFIRLIKTLRTEIDNIKDAQTGTQGHNLRQTSRFCTHLNDLIVQIIRCSYEISLPRFF